MSGRAAANTPAHAGRVADVGLVEAGAARQRGAEVLALAGGEVVDDGHLVAAIEERVDEVGADEAGSAGDQGTHGGGSYCDAPEGPPDG